MEESGGRVLTGEECLARRGGRSPAAPHSPPHGRRPGWRARCERCRRGWVSSGLPGPFLPQKLSEHISVCPSLFSGHCRLAHPTDVKSLQRGRLMGRFGSGRNSGRKDEGYKSHEYVPSTNDEPISLISNSKIALDSKFSLLRFFFCALHTVFQ